MTQNGSTAAAAPAAPPVQPQGDDPTLNLKRTYLSLLPPFQLIDIILAIDARSGISIPLFPPNLEDAIKQLRAVRQSYPPHMFAHPYYYHLPPGAPGANPPHKTDPSRALAASKTTVKVPQHSPPPAQSQLHPEGAPSSEAPSGSRPRALSQGQKNAAHSTAAAFARASTLREMKSQDEMPSYEEMIVEALVEINDPDGTPPKVLFAWMDKRYPLQSNFRPSASQALQKAFRRGRLLKTTTGKYQLDPNWEGGSTSRRTSRRPQPTQLNFPEPAPHPLYWKIKGEPPPQEFENGALGGNADSTETNDSKEDPAIPSRSALKDSLRSLALQLRELVSSRAQTQSGFG